MMKKDSVWTLVLVIGIAFLAFLVLGSRCEIPVISHELGDGYAGGQCHKWDDGHGVLTEEANAVLSAEMIRWIASSWYVEAMGIKAFAEKLMTMQPSNVEVFLQIRWTGPNPTGWLQHNPPRNPEEWQEYKDFCYDLAMELKGKVGLFQIGNEPESEKFLGEEYDLDDFIEYVVVGAREIKRANPSALVACGGWTGGRGFPSNMIYVFNGVENDVDIFDRHYAGIDKNIEEYGEEAVMQVFQEWADYGHAQGKMVIISEMSPYLPGIAPNVDARLMFDLWGGKQMFRALDENGIPTEAGIEAGIKMRERIR